MISGSLASIVKCGQPYLRSYYKATPHSLQYLSVFFTGAPQRWQNLDWDCFLGPALIGLRILDEGRRETICQTRTTIMIRPPVTIATIGQLMPVAAVDVAGNPGV